MTEQEKTTPATIREVVDEAIGELPDWTRAYAVMVTLGQYMAHNIMSGVHDESTVVYAREFYRVHAAVRSTAIVNEIVGDL